MPIDVNTRLNNLHARATDTVLAQSLRATEKTIDNHANPKSVDAQSHRLIRSWIIAELERRHPEASAKIDAVFEAAIAREDDTGQHVDISYTATLLDTINL
jgi:hypothetical protein